MHPTSNALLLLSAAAATASTLAGCASIMSQLPVKGPPESQERIVAEVFKEQPEIVRFPSRPAGDTPVELEGRMYKPGVDGMMLGMVQDHTLSSPVQWPKEVTDGTTILFCHGVQDNNASPMANLFSAAGFRVFQFDYRGFGNSTKAQTTALGLRDDTLAAVAYLRSRPDVDPTRIVLAGHSLGGAMAIAAAAELEAAGQPVAAVVSNAAPANSRLALEEHLPILGYFLGGIDGPQPEAQAARLIKTPLLITHPVDDDVLQPYHAKRLLDANRNAGGKAVLLLYPEGGHVKAYLGKPSYEAPVIGWLVYQLRPTTQTRVEQSRR